MCEVVHFVPDPFVDRRLPLGAVIKDLSTFAEPQTRVLWSEHRVDWECYGGWKGAALAKAALNALKTWNPSVDTVPLGFEEVLMRDAAIPLPAHWKEREIRNHVWGEPATTLKVEKGSRARTLGRAFLALRGVSDRVHDNFDPTREYAGRYSAAVVGGIVTHFVKGADRPLLLEPVRLDQAKPNMEAVAQRFAVWKYLRSKQEGEQQLEWPRLVAYAVVNAQTTPHSVANDNMHLFDTVRGFADYALDTRAPADADELVRMVRDAAPAVGL